MQEMIANMQKEMAKQKPGVVEERFWNLQDILMSVQQLARILCTLKLILIYGTSSANDED